MGYFFRAATFSLTKTNLIFQPQKRPVWDVCLEPSSQRRLVVGCGPIVLIVNAASGEIEGTYAEYHSDDVFSVAWGKDAADKVHKGNNK